MKKRIMLTAIILLLFLPIKAYASSTTVEVNIDGEVKKGEEINIVVNAKDLQGLYAASVNFNYDKSILNIIEINPGETIKEHSDEIMEIGGEVDTSNNKTSYSFTFLGDKEGLNGSTILTTIKAKVLSDSQLNIDEGALEVKLVKRAGDSVENYDYKFIGYNKEINNTEDKPNDSNSEENSSESNSSNSNNTNNDSSTGNSSNQESSNIDNIENETKEEETLDKNEEVKEDKKENSFIDKVISGNLLGNIINNIKDFISGNNSSENKTNEEVTSLDSNEDKNETSEVNEEKNSSESNADESISDNDNLDTSNDENKDEEVLDNNSEDENKDNKVIESNNDKKSNLIIYSLIVLFILFGAMYYYNRKKAKSSK